MQYNVRQFNAIQKIPVGRYIGLILLCMAGLSARGYAQDGKSAMVDAHRPKMATGEVSKTTSAKLQTIVTLKRGPQKLVRALQSIARQAGLKLSYSEQVIPYRKKVTINTGRLTAEQALWAILEETGYRFGISASGQLVLVKRQRPAPAARQETITGTVSDAQSGKTLPGVNIKVKGTTTGAATDADGQYELEVESLQDTLVVSFVGYETQQVPINGRTTINIMLKTTTVSGQQLTVVGYGEEQEANISTSQSGITNEDFNKEPVTSVSGALDGKIAGAHVQRTSGRPGAGYKLRIRGSNSINGNNSPLYVVDGLQVSSIDNIDPDNIGSMKVLKDASATAIYGSRGSNGVVLITTKSGVAGEKLNVNFRSSVGFQSVEKRMDLLNGPEFARTVNAEREATGGNPPFSDQQIANLEKTGGTDWQDVAFRDGAPIQQYHLSFTGGGENGVSYYISGGYLKQKGAVFQQDYKRYTLRSNIDYQYSDKLKFSLHMNGSREGRNGTVTNVNQVIRMDPTLPPVRDENGNYTLSSSYAYIDANPYIKALKNRRQNYNGRINSRGTVQYNFTKALSLNILGGVEYYNRNNNHYTSIIIDNKGGANIDNHHRLRAQNTNRLTYNKDFNENNHLKADLIFEQQYIRNEGNGINASDFPTDATGYKKVALASTTPVNSSFKTSKLLSYIGRVNYVWKNKYIFTASAREDGSSKFRKGHRYGFFPSGSIAWRLANEKFMENVHWLTKAKLRASYGATGSQAISSLATRAKLVTNSGVGYPINNGGSLDVGVAPSNNLANPDLTWETTKQADIGIDMAFLKARVTFTADIYKKETTDLLLNVPLPDITGVNNVTRNSGKIQNKGLELNVGVIPVQNDEVSFTANFNVSFNRNKVKSLGDREKIQKGPQNGATGGAHPILLQTGHPLGLFQGYTFEGVWQKEQAEQAAEYGLNPGDARYKDISGDCGSEHPSDCHNINGQDVSLLGNSQPDFDYGFNGTLDYRNFDLNLVIKGSYGGQIYNIIQGQLFGLSGNTLDPVTHDILNRWTPDNPSNTIPGFTTTSNSYIASSKFVEDGTYLKIKNLALGYTLPKNILNKFPLSSLRISASVQNLATFTKFKGFDPEIHSNGNNDLYRGLYYRFPAYPLSRTITFGLDIKF